MLRSISARFFAVALALSPVAAAVAFAPTAQADAPVARTYALDGVHSTVNFAVKHLGLANVQGQFGKVSGALHFDGKDTSTVKADITIDVKSIDTRNEMRDGHLKGDGFFDADKFPTITFKSKKSTAVEGGKFKLTGDLTMHGVTKEVTLDVDAPSAEIKHPMMPDTYALGTRATVIINRHDFGVGSKHPASAVIGDNVAITVDLEADRKEEKK